MSSNFDSDQVQHFVGSDLVTKYMYATADIKSRQGVNYFKAKKKEHK